MSGIGRRMGALRPASGRREPSASLDVELTLWRWVACVEMRFAPVGSGTDRQGARCGMIPPREHHPPRAASSTKRPVN